MADKEKPPPDTTTSLAAMADLATPMAVRVAATLRIADHLPASASELATTVDADTDALAGCYATSPRRVC